jgi:uncharacterized membrane protein
MATKKQRRRRNKERRHEYEYVYIDEEGNEIEVEQPPASRKEKERRAAVASNGKRPTQLRAVQPPNWRFMRKQAIIFFVILFAAFMIFPSKVNGNQRLLYGLLNAALFTVLMLPMMWMMQRTMYRSYLRRTGQPPPPRKDRSKDRSK